MLCARCAVRLIYVIGSGACRSGQEGGQQVVARSRRPWARIAAGGGALGASAAMLLGLALVLERDDKTAGVASMFVGLAGLALSALALARPREPPPSRPWSLTLSGWTGPPRRSRRRSRSNGRPRPGCGPCTGPRHWKTEPHGCPPCTPRNERSHWSSPHASSSADSALSCDAGRHSGTRFGSRVRRPDRRLGGSLRQFAVAAAASGLMWANMLRPFQLGKARTSHKGPWSWIRESRVASSQDSCPACHFTNASALAVM